LAAFITVQELADYMQRPDVLDDPAAEMAVQGACDVCRTVAGQPFTNTTSTVVVDGTGTDVLVLPRVPVSKVTSVTVGDTADTSYVADNGMLFKQSGTWRRGRRNVTVKLTHGYSDLAFPSDVKQVALAIAARLLNQAPRNAMAETVGDVQVRYAVAPTDLTANELRILRLHSGR